MQRFLRGCLLGFSLILLAGGCEERSSQQTAKKTPPANQPKPGGTQLGAAFQHKLTTPLAKLLADPQQWVGKTVRVKGVVHGFCHHRRAWFSLTPEKAGKGLLRVMTKPSFLVPKGLRIGETVAEAEGTVELKTVPEQFARHMAREHGMFGGEPSKISGPQELVQLRATGAWFAKGL